LAQGPQRTHRAWPLSVQQPRERKRAGCKQSRFEPLCLLQLNKEIMTQVLGAQIEPVGVPGQAPAPSTSSFQSVSRGQVVPSDQLRNSRTVSFSNATEVADIESAPSAQEIVRPQHTQTSRLSRRLQRSGRSLWRYPTSTGQVPRYMQRAFRLKTFGLLAFQLLSILGIGVLMTLLGLWKDFNLPSPAGTEIILYATGAVNLMSVLLLHFMSDRFPANYLCLALTTVISGFFWGLTHLAPQFSEIVHLQIGVILFITMLVAAVVSYALDSMERKMTGMSLLVISLGSGYLLGSVTDVLLFTLMFTATPFQILGAVGFALLLLGILLLDVGGLLVACQPDDYMTVVVAMNSTLLVIVSIPFFFLGFCILRLGETAAAAEAEDTHGVEAIPAATVGARR